MGYVVTFEEIRPPVRYDSIPWTSVDVLESITSNGTFAIIDTQALPSPDSDPIHPQLRNITTANGTVASGFYKLRFNDSFAGHEQSSLVSSVTDNLLTLDDYKSLLGVAPTDTNNDSQVEALLGAASILVRNFTGRDFDVSTGSTEDRTYSYDGCGYLDIDDCTAVTHLSTNGGVVGGDYDLDDSEWEAQPTSGSIFYYVAVFGGRWLPASPEMGFGRNLDQIGYMGRQPTLTVTAAWGWPEIPEDIKLATALVIENVVTGPDSDGLTSEAIEGFARSWGNSNSAVASLAIPNKARDILVNYQRVYA